MFAAKHVELCYFAKNILYCTWRLKDKVLLFVGVFLAYVITVIYPEVKQFTDLDDKSDTRVVKYDTCSCRRECVAVWLHCFYSWFSFNVRYNMTEGKVGYEWWYCCCLSGLELLLLSNLSRVSYTMLRAIIVFSPYYDNPIRNYVGTFWWHPQIV